jgi:hypothetical protein
MKVKTNLRAGSGGVATQKQKSSTTVPIVFLNNFVLGSTRCAGI